MNKIKFSTIDKVYILLPTIIAILIVGKTVIDDFSLGLNLRLVSIASLTSIVLIGALLLAIYFKEENKAINTKFIIKYTNIIRTIIFMFIMVYVPSFIPVHYDYLYRVENVLCFIFIVTLIFLLTYSFTLFKYFIIEKEKI